MTDRLRCIAPLAPGERYDLASWDDLPHSFSDPRCDDFLIVCSGGFKGGISLGSAFLHKPGHYPQCFPDGADGNALCTRVLLRRCKRSAIEAAAGLG